MTQLLGFAIGFLMSVGVVLYATGEIPWRATVCKVVPGCEPGTDTAAALNTATPAPTAPVQTSADKQPRQDKSENLTKNKVAPARKTEKIVAKEKALVTVPVPPAPKLWSESESPARATPPIEPLQTPRPATFTQETASRDKPNRKTQIRGTQQHVFWPAFSNSVSASGFAELIIEKTGLEVAVVKQKPGNYAVAIPYQDLPELQQNLNLIELAVGVKPLQGRRP